MGIQGAAVGGRPDARALEEPNDRSNRARAPRISRRGGRYTLNPHAVLRLVMRRLTLMRELLELGL